MTSRTELRVPYQPEGDIRGLTDSLKRGLLSGWYAVISNPQPVTLSFFSTTNSKKGAEFDIVEDGPRESSDRIAIIKLTDVYHGDKEICDKRASLIVAAPDMLEAGSRLHDVLWSHFDGKMSQQIVDALAAWVAAEEKATKGGAK